ncbi:hypothetical protein ACKE9L_11325, partial [Yersinia enterocolitica]
RNRAHKETGYMAAIPERYFQEKTLGLLGASIYGAARAIRDDFTASLRSTCFHCDWHFVINLINSFFKGSTDSPYSSECFQFNAMQ